MTASRSRVGTEAADENRTKLGELIWTVGASFLLYEYDFGDGWQHELLLEEVLFGEESFQQICVAGKRCCPPEDCGGMQGFAGVLKALGETVGITRKSFINIPLSLLLADFWEPVAGAIFSR